MNPSDVVNVTTNATNAVTQSLQNAQGNDVIFILTAVSLFVVPVVAICLAGLYFCYRSSGKRLSEKDKQLESKDERIQAIHDSKDKHIAEIHLTKDEQILKINNDLRAMSEAMLLATKSTAVALDSLSETTDAHVREVRERFEKLNEIVHSKIEEATKAIREYIKERTDG